MEESNNKSQKKYLWDPNLWETPLQNPKKPSVGPKSVGDSITKP